MLADVAQCRGPVYCLCLLYSCKLAIVVRAVVLARNDSFFFFQGEDGIRDLVRSRGLGDVYKRQIMGGVAAAGSFGWPAASLGAG